MNIDSYLTLIREQNPEGDIGRYGDSAFETSSYRFSEHLLGYRDYSVMLVSFLTEYGTVRHPNNSWPITSDNEMPLYVACRETGLHHSERFIRELRIKRGYRTGDGRLISPGYYAELKNLQALRCLFLLLQALIFWFPFRWSDSKKWFELSYPNSDGYLQFFHLSCLTPKCFRRLLRLIIWKRTLRKKIRAYYLPEPNSDWVVETHLSAVERHY